MLSSLHLIVTTDNPIGAAGGAHLGLGLMTNATLTSLKLDNCQIRDQGCKELAMGLRDNKTLRALSIGLNGISQPVGEELHRALVYGHKRSVLSGIDFLI